MRVRWKRSAIAIVATIIVVGTAVVWNRWRTPHLVWDEVPLVGDDLFGIPRVATLPLNFTLEGATAGGEQPWIRIRLPEDAASFIDHSGWKSSHDDLFQLIARADHVANCSRGFLPRFHHSFPELKLNGSALALIGFWVQAGIGTNVVFGGRVHVRLFPELNGAYVHLTDHDASIELRRMIPNYEATQIYMGRTALGATR